MKPEIISKYILGATKNECSFTRDCQAHEECQNIDDGGCVCNFGECTAIFVMHPLRRQCESYTDCPCR
jgi:hypothetical protein